MSCSRSFVNYEIIKCRYFLKPCKVYGKLYPSAKQSLFTSFFVTRSEFWLCSWGCNAFLGFHRIGYFHNVWFIWKCVQREPEWPEYINLNKVYVIRILEAQNLALTLLSAKPLSEKVGFSSTKILTFNAISNDWLNLNTKSNIHHFVANFLLFQNNV